MDILLAILLESWKLTIEMAPYLLLGFLAAGFLHVFIPIDMVGRHLGKESVSSILKAAIFGIPIPLCSCGVLPVAASLRKNGASKSSTLAFLITTPVTGVDSLMATYALLGWVFTIARLITALVIGFMTGFIMSLLSRKDTTIATKDFADDCKDSCCSAENTLIQSNNSSDSRMVQRVYSNAKKIGHYAFIELPESFAGSLLFGLLLAGAIAYFLPPELIKANIGSGLLGIAVATLIAIPLYVCATGSIPIAAAMIVSGFSPGAALAFLIAGPATNSVAMLTVKDILGKKALVIYILLIFIGAIGFGMLLDNLNLSFQSMQLQQHAHHSTSLFKLITAIILAGLLIVLYIRSKYIKHTNKIDVKDDTSPDSILLATPGFFCKNCANHIYTDLNKLSEVADVKVDIQNKLVSITLKKNISNKKILDTMESAGYPSEIKKD